MVEYSILKEKATRTMRYVPHQLESEEEAKTKKKVHDLLPKGLIGPSTSRARPVVPVNKVDKNWCFCNDNQRLNATTKLDKLKYAG